MALFGKKRLDGQVAYLATVREDLRPRLHPVTPVIGEGIAFYLSNLVRQRHRIY